MQFKQTAPSTFELEFDAQQVSLQAVPGTATAAKPTALLSDDGCVFQFDEQLGKYIPIPSWNVGAEPWMFNPVLPRPEFYYPEDTEFQQRRMQAKQAAYQAALFDFGKVALSAASILLFGGALFLSYLLVRSAIALTEGMLTHFLPGVFEGLAVAGFYVGVGLAILASAAGIFFYFRGKSDPATQANATAPAGDMHIHQIFVNGPADRAQQFTNNAGR
jgi:hypothetical protein